MNNNALIIIGASARAAAFSAYRAGYTPYWMDQFGDEDLRQRFRGSIIGDYPQAAVELIAEAPDAPFLFTGAMENHPGVLEQLCRQRTLLGNPRQVCSRVRDPALLYEALQRNRIACPALRVVKRGQISNLSPYPRGRTPAYDVRGHVSNPSPDLDGWLRKPLRSAGGIGTGHYEGQPLGDWHYLQEYLRGESFSAVFVASRGRCRLLGVTRQLVGLSEFHAGEFSYCGSIGPLGLDDAENRQWRRIGEVASAEFKLKGLFGVDAIKRQDGIYPVEVNPRYTASVEALELALEVKAIKIHCDACEGRPTEVETRAPRRLIGKAILFAPEDLIFTRCAGDGFSIADIPAAGTAIKQGQPILTVLVNGNSIASVTHSLNSAAGSIYKSLGIEYKGSE